MMMERLHLPPSRPLPDLLRLGDAVAALKTLFRAISYRPDESDTAIAWEDGEVRERSASPGRR